MPLALVGFSAGYRSLTHQARMMDLRLFTVGCHDNNVALCSMRRVEIEC